MSARSSTRVDASTGSRVFSAGFAVLVAACAGTGPPVRPQIAPSRAGAVESVVTADPIEEPDSEQRATDDDRAIDEFVEEMRRRGIHPSSIETQLDLDGDGHPEAIVVRRDTISIGAHELSIPAAVLQDSSDLQFAVVDLEIGDGHRELMVSMYADEDLRRYYFFSYGRGRVVASDPVLGNRPTIRGDGRVRFVTSNCGQTFTRTLRLRRRRLGGEFRRTRGRFDPDACVACPFVYVQSGGRWIEAGEILRHLNAEGLERWQSLSLPIPTARTIVVRVAEEKEEVTYLNALRLETGDGNPRAPVSCAEYSDNPVCADDDRYLTLERGEQREFTFAVPADARELTLLGRGYYLPVH